MMGPDASMSSARALGLAAIFVSCMSSAMTPQQRHARCGLDDRAGAHQESLEHRTAETVSSQPDPDDIEDLSCMDAIRQAMAANEVSDAGLGGFITFILDLVGGFDCNFNGINPFLDFLVDTNGDGIPDTTLPDNDGDGFPDQIDNNGDGIPDWAGATPGFGDGYTTPQGDGSQDWDQRIEDFKDDFGGPGGATGGTGSNGAGQSGSRGNQSGSGRLGHNQGGGNTGPLRDPKSFSRPANTAEPAPVQGKSNTRRLPIGSLPSLYGNGGNP